MAKGFNIFGKVGDEIADFDKGGVYIVGKPDNKYEHADKRGERGGYYHSQKQLYEAIDLAGASKFKTGIWDEEGQRKTYLNIVNFYRDVMKMKININVANYILKPTSLAYTWVVWIFGRIFKLWASMNDYDDQIDEYAHDLSTYGSCVAKKLDKCTERVPLRTLRNTQTAKSLYHAAAYGGYVIIESEFHYNEMEEYPNWAIDHLEFDKSYTTYERYGLVPASLLKNWENLSDQEVANYVMEDDDRMVLAVGVVILDGVSEGREDDGNGSSLLFLEKVSDLTWPLDECHAEKVDGRWAGKGEIEKQLENQISRNLNANYRRRGILWAAKKVFQSSDEDVQKNLVYEVADGEVLHVKPNGTISQVNTANQHSAEITADDNAVKENSQQNAFAFEVATGESMASGTPFRLGVILQQSVAQHFTLVRETFSNFLKRCFFDQIIPVCQNEYADNHEAIVALASPDIESFREDVIVYHTNMRIFDMIMEGKRPVSDQIRSKVEMELARNEYAFIEVPKKFYKNARFYMELNLTEDIGPDITDLTTLYSSMDPADPQRKNVLAQIFATRGKALPAILGPSPTQTVPNANPQPNAPVQAGGAPVASPAPIAA